MLFWIVMLINQVMYEPIDHSARQALQFLSFIELFIELAILVVFVIIMLQEKAKK